MTPSSCEQTVPSQVCACGIALYDNTIPLLDLDGETTLYTRTAAEPDSWQLNQRYTTYYMDPPHNCNEQLPTISQPRTDVTGLSDKWGTKKREHTSMQNNYLRITRGHGELVLARPHSLSLMTGCRVLRPSVMIRV